ncbi:MAG: type II secretion system F family protein [Bdellovibrionaceae bacterium]|nr:type II secretion system F family protein [Pseudobdellovibrionaceae bacterium]MBX3041316.1 type II secretion system F family protein [Pseudobdellovibrionaceae bacterium]
MLMAQIVVPMLGSLLLMMSVQRMSVMKALSEHKHRAFFVTAGFFPLIALAINTSPLVLWCLIGSLLVFLRVLDAFFRRFSPDFSLENALELLDQVILSMKSGRSLRNSLQDAVRTFCRHEMSRVLQELVARLEHGGDFSKSQPLAREFLREIRLIEAKGTKMIAAFESFRSLVRTRFIFRRRSGQVTLQTRVQAGVSCLLFAPLLLFHLRSGKFLDARTLISVVLFVIAQLWIHFLSRRYTWKV